MWVQYSLQRKLVFENNAVCKAGDYKEMSSILANQ